jgi:soluble lytic murein transglycosylase-like protein
MSPMRLAHIAALLAVLAAPSVVAGQCSPCVAHLSNGFAIPHLRHEVAGDTTRLYLSESGYLEVPTAQIAGYEQDDAPAPLVAQPPIPSASNIDDHIARASDLTGVDKDFVHSVIRHESNFNPRAVSPKGAQGLMQLMPGTARQLGVDNAFDPASNVQGGSQYLRELLLRYQGDAAKALAAYNAGPAAVDRYHGVPPYPETRSYVARVITSYNQRKLVAARKPSAKPASAAATKASSAPAAQVEDSSAGTTSKP